MVDVPTLHQLLERKLATVQAWTTKGEPSVIRPTPEGQRLIYDAMHENAQRANIASMRALDPEGSTDMEQDRTERKWTTDEYARTLTRCPAVNANTGMRCTRVDGHVAKRGWAHGAEVTWETTVEAHRLMIRAGGTW